MSSPPSRRVGDASLRRPTATTRASARPALVLQLMGRAMVWLIVRRLETRMLGELQGLDERRLDDIGLNRPTVRRRDRIEEARRLALPRQATPPT